MHHAPGIGRHRPHSLHQHHHQVLQLDVQGTPQAWISLNEATLAYATDSVAWTLGAEPLQVMRGGINAAHGRQSLISVHPIIALRGASK